MRPALTLCLLALAAGCGHHVGDTCATNVDCSPLGDRFCDVASPSGYCTIEGCDVRLDTSGNQVDSCQAAASESVCVRFFSLLACKPCNPQNPGASCAADEICLCDNTEPSTAPMCSAPPASTVPASQQCHVPDGGTIEGSGPGGDVFAGKLGHCAKQSSERRWCMLKCNSDSDCRSGGYHCVAPGTDGAEPVPRPPSGVGDYSQRFCVYTGT